MRSSQKGRPPVNEEEVLDLLTALVQKSLVVYEEDEAGQGRYRLLETVRQYARDRLLEASEAAAVRDRHRDWFLALAEREGRDKDTGGAAGHVRSPGALWARLEAEHDNLRAALGWSAERGEAEAGLRLARALCEFWMVRGHLWEGREHLAGLLALPGAEAPTAARATALDHAHWLAVLQGDFGAARALLEERLAIFRELGDQRDIHGSLYNLARVVNAQGDHGTAQALLEESLAICRELGLKEGIGKALLHLALVAHAQGDDEAARALLEEAGALGDGAWNCFARGHVLLEMGDYAAARSCYGEGLALRRAAGDTQGTAASLVEVGAVAWLQGEHAVTRSNAREALGLFRELGYKEGPLIVLESLGAAALGEGRKEHAARLLGAAAAWRAGGAEGAGSVPVPEMPAAPWWRRPRERISEAARAASLEQEFAAAWAEGQAMPLEQAIALALEEADDA